MLSAVLINQRQHSAHIFVMKHDIHCKYKLFTFMSCNYVAYLQLWPTTILTEVTNTRFLGDTPPPPHLRMYTDIMPPNECFLIIYI